ncbi:MAG: glycoside hydrolase family 3 protein, partial [Clostridia bacterium]|nr:glycoside hydrolase family 3 protein [Clostridia bacterium]
MMKKKRKRKMGLPAAIMICVIILLAAVLCVVLYAQGHKNQTSGKKTEDTGSNNADNEQTDAGSDVDADLQVPEETENGEQTGGASSTADSELNAKIEEKIAQMTLEEKVAQLFIITPDALTGVDGVTAAGDTTKQALQQYPVGGLIYFEQNLDRTEQVKTMLENVQTYSVERIGLPAILVVDEEGGTVRRISGKGEFGIEAVPDMADIGASGDTDQAYETGKTIGTYLGELGFNLDFAPVADVLDAPDNAIWARRSFGMDSALDGQMVAAQVRGMQDAGVLATLKHFPGHGSARTDSHDGMAVVDKSKEELASSDWIPFQSGIEAGAGVVMVGHISVPAVIGDDTPSSLSYRMVTEILRNELGYTG